MPQGNSDTQVFGDTAATRVLPFFIALSALGNVVAVTFTGARGKPVSMQYSRSVKQELAKEGIFPFSRFWASNKPFRTPAAAFILQWIVAMIFIVGPPAGDLYSFVINLTSYQEAFMGTLVGSGLLYLRYRKSENWTPPFRTHILFTVFFIFAHLVSVVVPFIPPREGKGIFQSIPYYVFPMVGLSILLVGVIYWFVFVKVVPKLRGYKLVVERETLSDGKEVVRYKRLKLLETISNEKPFVPVVEAIDKVV